MTEITNNIMNYENFDRILDELTDMHISPWSIDTCINHDDSGVAYLFESLREDYRNSLYNSDASFDNYYSSQSESKIIDECINDCEYISEEEYEEADDEIIVGYNPDTFNRF